MKNIYYILFMIVTLGLVSCSDNSLGDDPIDGSAMKVNMNVAVPLYQSQETSSRAGAADPDGDALRTMYLLCFDENGYYISKSQATINSANSANDGAITGKITCTIPSNTSRVHFVANANMTNIDDAHYKGVSENVMIPSLYSGYGIVNYWGYKRCATASEMNSFLSNSSNTIQLIRNQARVTARSTSTTTTYTINGIAVCHLKAFGTVALYDKTKFGEGQDPFTDSFNDVITLDAKATNVSSLSDDKNIAADDPTDVSSDTYFNIFEGPNTKTDAMVAVVEVNSKYYKILLQDADYNFLTIHRNHEYRINIKSLNQSHGYPSFSDALNGVAANSPFITVDDIVATLDYGNYELAFPDGTSQIFNTAGEHSINFTYKNTTSGVTPSVADIKASWETNAGFATSKVSVSQVSYDATNKVLKGTINFTLNEPTESLQSGKLAVQIAGTPIMKTINIYSIKAFKFTPVYVTQKACDAQNQEMVVAFNIPANFPASLLPLKCKISTNRYDATSDNVLQIENEKLVDNNGAQLEDWNYKYIYYAKTTGPQRVYFKTIDNGYANGGTGSKNVKVYLEAPNFSMVAGQQFSYNSTSTNQITLASSDSYSSNKFSYTGNPISGQEVTVNYKMSVKSGLYIYTKNFVPSGFEKQATSKYDGVNCYYKADVQNGQVILTSQNYAYSENVWFESDNNKSACAMIKANDSYFSASNALSMYLYNGVNPTYGIGSPVHVSFNFPLAGTYKIYTKYLDASSSSGLNSAGAGVYTYNAKAGTTTLVFTTNSLITNETLKVEYVGSNASIASASCALKNTPITGTLTCTTFRDTPFIYIEDTSGNRVGTITRSGSGKLYNYSLTLRSYYNLTKSSTVYLLTNDTNNKLAGVKLTIADLLNNASRILVENYQ